VTHDTMTFIEYVTDGTGLSEGGDAVGAACPYKQRRRR